MLSFCFVYLRVRHSVSKILGTRSVTLPRCKYEKVGLKNPCRHGRFSICAAPLIFASSRELPSCKTSRMLRHTPGGEAMLAPMTEIDLPPCIGFLVPAFSHLHRGTVRLRVPECLRTLCRTRKIYIDKNDELPDFKGTLPYNKTVHRFLLHGY